MVLETPKHAWQSQTRLQAKDPKPATPVAPKREVILPYSWGGGSRSWAPGTV